MRYNRGNRAILGMSMIVFMLPVVTWGQSSRVDCNDYGFGREANGLNNYPTAVKASLKFKGDPDLVIFEEKDLKQALRYLTQYCCEGLGGENGCDLVESGESNYYPQSPYIFDHLVSIGMRKLDGIQEHCDELGITCNATSSYQVEATKRREEITEIAESTEGYPPAQIEGLFKQYRGTVETFLEEKTLLSNAYFTMCQEAENIRLAIGNNQQDNDYGLNQSPKEACDDLVKARYGQELAYVRTLMVEKGLHYLAQNVRSYIIDYQTQERMTGLMDKYNNLYSCFAMVLRYVERTNCCNE